MDEQSALALIAYSVSLPISYGENWTNLLNESVPGYEVINGHVGYKFNGEDVNFHREADEAIMKYWNTIY